MAAITASPVVASAGSKPCSAKCCRNWVSTPWYVKVAPNRPQRISQKLRVRSACRRVMPLSIRRRDSCAAPPRRVRCISRVTSASSSRMITRAATASSSSRIPKAR